MNRPVPSIKTLTDRLALDTNRAEQFRAWMQTLSHRAALERMDKALDNHGVEYIKGKDYDYHDIGDIGNDILLYSNAGDTYNTTIMFDCKSRRWIVGAWGDIVEKQELRFKDACYDNLSIHGGDRFRLRGDSVGAVRLG